MCSVLSIRHYEAREQPTGVPRRVTPGLQREILETRAGPAKLHSPGLVMLLALPGLVFLAGGAMAPAQEFSRPILSSGLRDTTQVRTQSIAKPGQPPPLASTLVVEFLGRSAVSGCGGVEVVIGADRLRWSCEYFDLKRRRGADDRREMGIGRAAGEGRRG